MAIKNAVQCVQTSMPRVTHNLATEMATKADVDVALVYSAAIMAISGWELTDLVNNTHTAKVHVLVENKKLPPVTPRARKEDGQEVEPTGSTTVH